MERKQQYTKLPTQNLGTTNRRNNQNNFETNRFMYINLNINNIVCKIKKCIC